MVRTLGIPGISLHFPGRELGATRSGMQHQSAPLPGRVDTLLPFCGSTHPSHNRRNVSDILANFERNYRSKDLFKPPRKPTLVGRMLRSRQGELAQLVYQPMRQRLYIALPAAYRPAVDIPCSVVVEGYISSDLVARSLDYALSKPLMLHPQAYDSENQVLNEAQATTKTCALQLANAVCLLMHEHDLQILDSGADCKLDPLGEQNGVREESASLRQR
ncbi:uncharacterized protein CLUP02_05446 [Colletotrichum lupini]|uniref:Uncharacterized protein n=1 Tax=Colletotrichum lupini TaxID=145971 RepID=A0A9Q8SMK3_9PEZI|nr:uncharacterized protein CLUP02_05446 [Colletotrichum lupini]UQC79965.1 hypothetical protein CLUP02_05446 [Colletotrichum lupini]